MPEGRNHYYELYNFAKANATGEWGTFHWKSAEILPAEEIAAARLELDELTFRQEYEADFLNFTGRAYYAYDEKIHEAELGYNADAPLIVCLDFNVAPGIAVICQEQALPTPLAEKPPRQGDPPPSGTGVIGEVYIPQNSNTERVCRKIIADWGQHRGRVELYGDATGGAAAALIKVMGSDWDPVKATLNPHFGARISYHVKTHNPPERSRVNAVNSRLMSAAGTVRMMLDPRQAPRTKQDLGAFVCSRAVPARSTRTPTQTSRTSRMRSVTMSSVASQRGPDSHCLEALAMTTSTEVGKPSAAYNAALPSWGMVEALKGGTSAMRAARETYLPRHEAEKEDAYNARLARSFLFTAYARTIELLVGKAFSKPVTPGDEVPEPLKVLFRTSTSRAPTCTLSPPNSSRQGLDEGLSFVLVDLPNTTPATTLAEERQAGVRPYWSLIRASSVIGWRVVVENGKPILDQLRVREDAVLPDGEFGEKAVQRVRVYYRDGRWELWQADTPQTGQMARTYQIIEDGRLTIGRIPLVAFYAKKVGHMQGRPRLEDLAWLNVEHWQKSSDQNHILHVARVPILFGKGFEGAITVSPNSLVTAQGNTPTSSTSSTPARRSALGRPTSTAWSIEWPPSASTCSSSARPRAAPRTPLPPEKRSPSRARTPYSATSRGKLKLTLDAALALTAEWQQQDPEQVGEIDMDTQIGVPAAEKTDLEVLLKARMAGEISAETFFAEMQRREVLDPSIDFEEERDRIEQEGPALGLPGMSGNADGTAPEDDPDAPKESAAAAGARGALP